MISDRLIEAAVSFLNQTVSHIGIGGGAVPDTDDAVLADELLRKAATSYIDGNVVIKEVYIDETELNGEDLFAVGLYGDNNTVLFAGGGIRQIKTSGESLTVSVELSVERA